MLIKIERDVSGSSWKGRYTLSKLVDYLTLNPIHPSIFYPLIKFEEWTREAAINGTTCYLASDGVGVGVAVFGCRRFGLKTRVHCNIFAKVVLLIVSLSTIKRFRDIFDIFNTNIS